MFAVRLREVSALERVQLQRYKCNSAGTKFAVRFGEASGLESVGFERVDYVHIDLYFWNQNTSHRQSKMTEWQQWRVCILVIVGYYPAEALRFSRRPRADQNFWTVRLAETRECNSVRLGVITFLVVSWGSLALWRDCTMSKIRGRRLNSAARFTTCSPPLASAAIFFPQFLVLPTADPVTTNSAETKIKYKSNHLRVSSVGS